MVAAPAVVAIDRLMPVRSIVQRYATVYGVGHDFEVVEWIAWNAQDALRFARLRGGIDKFREVTDVVYEVSMPPLPTPAPMSHWSRVVDPISAMDRDIEVMDGGITTVSSFSKINEWRGSLRPDLGGLNSKEWVEELIATKQKLGITTLG
jgi:hypothetical protein